MVNILFNLHNGNGHLNDKRVTRSSSVAFNFCEWNNDTFVIKTLLSSLFIFTCHIKAHETFWQC